jgi:hypothetical protein
MFANVSRETLLVFLRNKVQRLRAFYTRFTNTPELVPPVSFIDGKNPARPAALILSYG